MADFARCAKCNQPFEENSEEYCGRDFCPECRIAPQKSVIEFVNLSYQQYLQQGLTPDHARQKSHQAGLQVARARKRMGC